MRTEAFTQIGLDSGALGALGSVVHRFEESGTYLATVFADGREEGEVTIKVGEGGQPALQVDMAATAAHDQNERCCEERALELDVGGYASFYVGSGNRRYAVVVRRPGKRAAEFDSRQLQAGDLFAATVLRPGKYVVRNEHGKGTQGLEVRYVKRGRTRYQPAKPIKLKMGEALEKRVIKGGPAQGLIFEATAPTRAIVELVEPDDGDGKGDNDKSGKGYRKPGKKRAG